MNWRLLLWPFSLIYGGITSIRNLLFNIGVLRSKSFPLPVICIGNLSTGGTGKTPMTEYLLKNITNQKAAVVSRGYGRKTKGLILANPNSTVEEIGDEPWQIFHKFKNLKMALAEKRVEGIDALLKSENLDFILLDDAYQHRYVKPSFSILLSTFSQPFYQDYILPSGNLRESTRAVSRADIILFTKCPNDLGIEQAHIIKSKFPGKEVYFSTISYGSLKNHLGKGFKGSKKILALTGIAKPKLFIEHLAKSFEIQKHLKFPDHYQFTDKDINSFKKMLDQNPELQIICTEKDWVRLQNHWDDSLKSKIYHLPIELEILFDEGDKFLNQIERHLKTFKA